MYEVWIEDLAHLMHYETSANIKKTTKEFALWVRDAVLSSKVILRLAQQKRGSYCSLGSFGRT